MTLALLCSGQGLQTRTMFDLFANAPEAEDILSAAGVLLGRDLRAFLADATDDELHANRAGQILCVARALAADACLSPTAPLLLAGYSVGEMAAWGLAGIWTAEQALRLTARRAELMDEAGGTHDGLGFIRGLDLDIVSALVARFGCAIAIINPRQLLIIGGERSDVSRCCDAALLQGARNAGPIAVRVASHTARLQAAVSPFEEALQDAVGEHPRPGLTLIGSADAGVVDAGSQSLHGLARQLATCVNWAATLDALVERGADRMLELGPGAALADMARAAYPDLNIRALGDFRSLDGVRAWMNR